MAQLQSSLIVSLIDRVTSPAKAAAAAIRGIGAAARAANTGIMAAIERNNQALAQTRSNLLAAGASAYGLYKGLSTPIKAAMDFETSMSNVRKVVDFESPAAFKKMGDDIRAMSKVMPMTAENIADIVQAAGQGGVARQDLLKFAEGVIKVSTAWDTGAGMTGEALAQMMTAMGLTVPEVMKLADQMNYLSNETAASAPKILDFMQRVGPSGKVAGFAADEVAAYGTAMISAGFDADVAATTFRRVAQALTLGASATKRQRQAFNALGLDSVAVSKSMQKNAAGTTESILDLIAAQPKDKQGAFIHDIFGEEARAVAVLIVQRELTKQALLLAKSHKAAGSAQREYEVRLETTRNKLQLFNNKVRDLSRSIGFALMPSFNKALDALEPYIEGMTKWVEANGKVVVGIAKLVTGFVGLRIARVAARFGIQQMSGLFLGLLRPIGLVIRALTSLRGALLLTGIGGLLVAIGAAGKFIHDNWTGLGVFFREFGESFKKGLGGENAKSLESLFSTIEKIGKWIAGDSWKLDDSMWKSWGESAGDAAAKMAIRVAEAMDRIIAGIEGVQESWRKLMWAITGDVKYAPKKPELQQQWQGEGDTQLPVPPVREASFEPSLDIQGYENDPLFRHRMLRAEMFPHGTTIWDRQNDKMMQGDAARRAGMVDVPLSDAWIGAQIGKIRELVKDVPLSDAWLANRFSVPAPADTEKAIVEGKANVDAAMDSLAASISTVGAWLRGLVGAPTPTGATPSPETTGGSAADIPPPPSIIGSPPTFEPSVVSPEIVPTVDPTAINDLNQAVTGVHAGMTELSAMTVAPKADPAALNNVLGLIARIKAGLAEIGAMSVGVAGTVGERLQAGGTVNRLSRAQNSDYGHEAGGG